MFEAFLLNNGAMYHIAHSTAILEHVITMYFKPSAKTFSYVSQAGILVPSPRY